MSTDRDRCPTAVDAFPASDGALIRIRLPGGQLTPTQLAGLADIAARHGGGSLEMTSRGSLQIRRVDDVEGVGRVLADLELIPSRSHEKARNVLASPLSGAVGGWVDVRPLVRELDSLICASPVLSVLSGRFLFALDDGRGDVAAEDTDVAMMAEDETRFRLILAGRKTSLVVPAGEVAAVAVAAASEFVGISGGAWRIGGSGRGAQACGAAAVMDALGVTDDGPLDVSPQETGPVGWFPQTDGLVALGGGVRLGVLSARDNDGASGGLAAFIAAIGKPIVVTAWRSVIVRDLSEWEAEQVVRVLAPMGLIFDAQSPDLLVSACSGGNGCDRCAVDVRGAALDALAGGGVVSREHWVGCERGCGSPRANHQRIIVGG